MCYLIVKEEECFQTRFSCLEIQVDIDTHTCLNDRDNCKSVAAVCMFQEHLEEFLKLI